MKATRVANKIIVIIIGNVGQLEPNNLLYSVRIYWKLQHIRMIEIVVVIMSVVILMDLVTDVVVRQRDPFG